MPRSSWFCHVIGSHDMITSRIIILFMIMKIIVFGPLEYLNFSIFEWLISLIWYFTGCKNSVRVHLIKARVQYFRQRSHDRRFLGRFLELIIGNYVKWLFQCYLYDIIRRCNQSRLPHCTCTLPQPNKSLHKCSISTTRNPVLWGMVKNHKTERKWNKNDNKLMDCCHWLSNLEIQNVSIFKF